MFNPRNKNIITGLLRSLRMFRNDSLSNNRTSSVRCMSSKKTPEISESQAYTVSYLRDKVKLPEKLALKASRCVNFETPENPDSVIAFLKEQGCMEVGITDIIRVAPNLLCSDVEKTLVPKVEFFRSKGASDTDVYMVLFNSIVVANELEECIIPCFNHLSNLFQSDSKAIEAIRGYPFLTQRRIKEETLLPQIQFFQSRGASASDIFNILFVSQVLDSSLEQVIIPCFNDLTNLFQSDSKTIAFASKNPYLVKSRDLLDDMLLNIKTLRDSGVPESNIVSTFYDYPCPFKSFYFHKSLEKVMELGIDPWSENFLHALTVCRGQRSKVRWQMKFNCYEFWGLSEEVIWEAFRRDPCVLEVEYEQILVVMEFLANTMGFQPWVIVNQLGVLGLSFHKCIVPRGLHAKLLMSIGLIKEELSLSLLYDCSEEEFVERFVRQYTGKASALMKMYKKNLKLGESGEYHTPHYLYKSRFIYPFVSN